MSRHYARLLMRRTLLTIVLTSVAVAVLMFVSTNYAAGAAMLCVAIMAAGFRSFYRRRVVR